MRKVVVPWLPSVYRGRTTWAITLYPFVFVIKSKKDDPGVLAHEMVHIRQVEAMGVIPFYWNYATNRAFRRSVEAEGYAKQKEVENA